MALKAEVPVLDYIKVSLKCKREEEKTVADPPAPVPVVQDGANTGLGDRGEQPVLNVVAEASQAKPSTSWREEYLIGQSSGHDRPVCMVCGGVLSASGPAAAREHILQHHAHSLDFSPEEKQNILEAWSEGVILADGEMQPSLEAPGRQPQETQGNPVQADNPRKRKEPAEIEVLIGLEEKPASRKQGQLKARCGGCRCSGQREGGWRFSPWTNLTLQSFGAETTRSDPGQRSQVQQRPQSSDSAKADRNAQLGKVTGKEWPSECGVPGSAPAEIRIFTDGSFPAGFALKLYCRTQPEPAQDSGAKPVTRKATANKTYRDCSVSLLRLHSTDSSPHLGPTQSKSPRPLSNSCARGNVKDCGAKLGPRKAPEAKRDPSPLAKSFDPAWRARFLMDFDAITGRLVCMVCENALRQVCLATVKRHILQCHAETLHLPREVRRTIREVWETRGQSPTPAVQK